MSNNLTKAQIDKIYSTRWYIVEAAKKANKNMTSSLQGALDSLNELLPNKVNLKGEKISGKLEKDNKLPKPNSKKRDKIVFVIGHSRLSSGAWSPHLGKSGMSEYTFYSKHIVPIIKRRAEQLGIPVAFEYRDGSNIWDTGVRATKLAGKNGVVVNLHFNWMPQGVTGHEVMYDSREKYNKEFAKAMNDYFASFFGGKNRGLKLTNSGNGSSNLKSVTVTSCLIEPASALDKKAMNKMWSKRKEFSHGILDVAYEQYLKQSVWY